MLKKRLKQDGFTIIELLITIAVLGITIPSFSALISSIGAVNDQARDLTFVTSLAENKIESLRSIGFVGIENGTYDFTDELPASIGSPKQATYTVSSASTAVKQIDVSVTYKSYNDQKTFTYRTYIGELGVGRN